MSSNKNIAMVILDLDGVITSTAKTHAQAWKQMFDPYLLQYSQRTKTAFEPMDPDKDYRLYVDGRPRYEGAQKFLLSRGINLPFGNPHDEPGKETVCGLGNKKNQIYLSLLHDGGVHVFQDTIDMVRFWKNQGLKLGVISASKNCREVLASAGITALFDKIVDGVDSVENSLKGKPEPDIFLFAANQMGVDPSHAAIVEDSSAGIEAGKKGHFAYKIGVARNGDARLLYNHGADIVVSLLTQIPGFNHAVSKPFKDIPSALSQFEIITSRLLTINPVLLLDYDGTLTPIVSRPELAVIAPRMREAVKELSQIIKVAIVSGRDLADVKELVGLDNLLYAGSHGFEIEGPDNIKLELQSATNLLTVLEKAEQGVRENLTLIEGVLIERKKYALTIHYRMVNEKDISLIHQKLMMIASRFEQLKLTGGKKVFELRPALNWDKGKAIQWIVNKIFSHKKASALYMGDDLTDEDAFKELKWWGTGILVGDHGQNSFADFKLKDTIEVLQFLINLKGKVSSMGDHYEL